MSEVRQQSRQPLDNENAKTNQLQSSCRSSEFVSIAQRAFLPTGCRRSAAQKAL